LGIAAVILFVGGLTLAFAREGGAAALRAGEALDVEQGAIEIVGGGQEDAADVLETVQDARVPSSDYGFAGVLASQIFFSQNSADSSDGVSDFSSFSGQGGELEFDIPQVQSSSVIAFTSPLTNLASSNTRDEVITYLIQEGDTVSEIAAAFGISANSIIWANNLRNADYLRPGTNLTILPSSGVLYQVKSGDTLGVIVKRYAGDLEKTLAVNDLPLDGTIAVGQEIIIVDGTLPQPSRPRYAIPSAPQYASAPVSVGYFIYPTTGRNWGRIHSNNGVDIANSCGTPIYAAQEGKVILSDGVGWNGGFGIYIKIKHPNGLETLYSHNSRNLVSAGDYVKQGQLIAYMGSTGRSTGCHLHFEVHGARNPLAR